MKKFLNYLLTFLVMLTLVFVGVNTTKLDALYSSSTLREAEEAKVTNLVGGVTLYKQRLETLYNGTGVSGNIKDLWNNHTVQWVDLPASNTGVKVVTWSKGNTNGWQKATVKQTMQDFESKHPGWIVVAGVNGDFFDNSSGGTSEPTGFYVQDGGEVFRPDHAGAGYRLTLGWNNDGSYITGRPTHDEKMTLHVGDKEYTVNSVNSAPAAEGVTLLTVDASSAYDLTGYTVYKVDNGAYRVASGNKKLFVKGYVVSLEDSLSSVKAEKGYFYLASKDGSLDGLKADDFVKVQYDLTGNWANVNSAVGYIYQVLINNEHKYENNGVQYDHLGVRDNDFIYTTHPRTLVGFKEDGSTVLMVVDGRGKASDYLEGASLYQCGELLQHAGCVNGFNLDGGGSSTLVVRNEQGGFDVINTPSDGTERYIGNAILFVMEDPGIKTDASYSDRSSIKIDINENTYGSLQNVVAVVDGKEYPFTSNSLVINGLNEDTKYQVKVKYQIKDYRGTGNWLNNETLVTAYTAPFVMPSSGLKIDSRSITDVGFKVIKEDFGHAANIRNVVIQVGDSVYQMGDAMEFVINDLIIDTEYDVSITYEVYDELTGKLYPGSLDPVKVKTASFITPSITRFEEKGIISEQYVFAYTYADKSSKVEEAYLLVNDVKHMADAKSGNFRIADIDLNKSSYTIKFVLEYTNDQGEKVKVESETITLNQIVQEPKKGCKKKAEAIICFTTAIAVIGVLLRKKH